MKTTCLEKQSTIVQMESKLLERRSPVIKLTEISVQDLVEIGRGISFPAGGFDDSFVRVHT